MTLVEHEVGPCEALVLQAATGRSPADALRANRGWSIEEWNAASESLMTHGWLDSTGAITTDGAATRDAIERETDRLAAAAFAGLGTSRTTELVDALRPLAGRVMESGAVPAANNMGVPWPPQG
jgi:hypothetical protein